MPSKRTYKAPDVEYEFDSHRIGYGSNSCIAVNVKCHAHPKLVGEYHDMLDVLRKADPKIEDVLRTQAWEDVSEAWWDSARTLAKQIALGDVHSEGRSGGWLVLKDWTPSRVEELIEELEVRCVHCDQLEEEHATSSRGQDEGEDITEYCNCLFGPTTFVPTKKLGRSAKERLDELSTFTTELERSLELVADTLQHTLEQLIKDAYYEHINSQKDQPDA